MTAALYLLVIVILILTLAMHANTENKEYIVPDNCSAIFRP